MHKAKHAGQCNVKTNSGKFGRWVGSQRCQYRLLKEEASSYLSEERVQKLESIEFQWSFGGLMESDYLLDIMFQVLKTYKAKH